MTCLNQRDDDTEEEQMAQSCLCPFIMSSGNSDRATLVLGKLQSPANKSAWLAEVLEKWTEICLAQLWRLHGSGSHCCWKRPLEKCPRKELKSFCLYLVLVKRFFQPLAWLSCSIGITRSSYIFYLRSNFRFNFIRYFQCIRYKSVVMVSAL